MNKSFLIVFSLFMLQTLMAQQRDKSIILYDKGNAAVARKDYRTADSLFTLSLNLVPHPDSYFNRAVCRRQLNDFKGYCLDLSAAGDLGDKESNKLYWKQCAKADTVFKKNNGEFAIKSDFDIVEFTTTYRYNTDFEYEKCDTTGTPIISKIRVDNAIIYRYCKEVKSSQYSEGLDSLIQYIKTKTEFSKQVKQKNLAGYSNISITTDENGQVKNVKILVDEKDETINELTKSLLNMPNWHPAIYNNKTVKFKTDLSITYYDDVIEIYPKLPFHNGMNETFSVVEEMPEFPGGAMEMMKHIQKNIRYPEVAKEVGISGRCFLRFVVNTDGTITNIQILKGVTGCSACNKEAVRVIQTMPKWKPGTQNGKPVSVFFNLPINFQLK